MNYLPKSRTRRPVAKLFLILFGMFVFGAIIFSVFDGLIITAVSPLWKAENMATVKFSWIGNFFRTKNSLVSENVYLRDRISELELESASRSSLTQTLDGEVVFGRKEEDGGITASALVSPPQSPYDVLVIDAGSREGVTEGSNVVMSDGPILGVVEQVYARSAKIRLYSTPGVKTAAVLERHGIPVTLEGVGGGNFKIIVPRETEIEVGDRILSADVFSHLLAVVGDVNMKPTDSFKDVLAKGPVNIFNIHLILVRQ